MYVLTHYLKKFEPFATWEGAFTNEELDILQRAAKNSTTQGQVGMPGGSGINADIRRSEVTWISPESEFKWVFDRLAHVTSSLNSEFFNLDLTGFGESLQLTNYTSINTGMYTWHQDMGIGVSRKLSVVTFLTDASEYEGGHFELIITNPNEPVRVKKQRGLTIAFPSWMIHQVTPVTSGSRQSLVAWVTGPNLR